MQACCSSDEVRAAAGWALLRAAMDPPRGTPKVGNCIQVQNNNCGSSSRRIPSKGPAQNCRTTDDAISFVGRQVAPDVKDTVLVKPSRFISPLVEHSDLPLGGLRMMQSYGVPKFVMSREATGVLHGGMTLKVGSRMSSKGLYTHAIVTLKGFILPEAPTDILQYIMNLLPKFLDRINLCAACAATKCLEWRLAPPLLLNEELSGFRLGDKGACAVAQALAMPPNNSLGELCLGENCIGDIGAQAIASALGSGAKLRRLSLRNNSIGDDGARALARVLSMQTMLEEIDLWGNRLTDAGKTMVVSRAAKCEVFLELHLTPISATVSAKLRTILFDWISQVLTGMNVPLALDGSMDPQDVLFRTFSYVDTYLAKKSAQPSELQLSSIACMLAAAGLDINSHVEDNLELSSWLTFVTDGACTASDVCTVVHELHQLLAFETHQPTVYTFLRRYLRRTGWTDQSFSLANYLIEIAATDCHFAEYKPQAVAAAAAVLSRQYLSQGINVRPMPGWKKRLLRCANVDLLQELAPCIESMAHLHSSVHRRPHTFVNKKYSWARLHMVAKIPPNFPADAAYFVKYLTSETP